MYSYLDSLNGNPATPAQFLKNMSKIEVREYDGLNRAIVGMVVSHMLSISGEHAFEIKNFITNALCSILISDLKFHTDQMNGF